MKKIAIVGAHGQLGAELVRLVGETAIPLTHSQFEVSDLNQVRTVLTGAEAEGVINCAAYNWVDKAEDEPATAYAVNSLGPRHLALVCGELDLPLLHVSSDYVYGLDSISPDFAPPQKPYTEQNAPGPVSAYGLSKLAGEYFVRSNCPKHTVVRTCGLYGHAISAGKGNFVKTMLRLGREKGHVKVVSDQYCTPTSTADLAPTLLQLFQNQCYGLFHVTNDGGTTWCDLTREIYRVAGLNATVEPITTQQFGAKAKRPAYSVLDCSKAAAATGQTMPTWQDAVARYVKTL